MHICLCEYITNKDICWSKQGNEEISFHTNRIEFIKSHFLKATLRKGFCY